jgi:hypothetical protein
MMRARAARLQRGIRIDQGAPMSPNSTTALPGSAACEVAARRRA